MMLRAGVSSGFITILYFFLHVEDTAAKVSVKNIDLLQSITFTKS